jgi:hypothetical protein
MANERTIYSSYTALLTDDYIFADTTGGAIVVTLPPFPALGQVFHVSMSAGASTVTVNPGAQSITALGGGFIAVFVGSGYNYVAVGGSGGGGGGVTSFNARTGAVVGQATDIPVFIASGASHAVGTVPDPGATPGTTRFLREDATWTTTPAGGAFVATGGVTAISPADRAALILSVQDQGVVNDGTTAGAGTDNATDMAAAITKANALYVATGQPCIIEGGNGVYALASAVAMKSGVILRGGTYVTKNASTYATAMHSLFTASGITTFGFQNCVGYGVGPDQKIAGPCTDSSTLGGRDSFCDIDNSSEYHITDCSFYRYQNAVLVSRSSYARLVANYINSLSAKTIAQLDAGTFTPYSFTGDPGGGIRFLGERGGFNETESDHVVCSNNVIVTVGLDICIDLTSQSGYPFRMDCIGNYCAGANSGIQIYTSGAAVPDPGTLTTTDRGANIAGNAVMWCYQQGIYIRGVEGVSCTGNKVTRCALIGDFVGTSAGGIMCRGTTNSTFPTSPVAHDLHVLIAGNQVIDCGAPLTGVLDAGIRCDALHVSVLDNQVIRSADRFGANILASGSVGILGLDTGSIAQWRMCQIKNNVVRGFATGISASYAASRTLLNGGFSCAVENNQISSTTNGININTSSSGFRVLGNTITDPGGTSVGIYIKNTPYSHIDRNFIEGYLTGIQLASGSLASDYWGTGGRQGPTFTMDYNQINLATTPISIVETITGDVSVRSRCITANGNLIDGAPFNRDSTGSITYTAAPTASDFRTWHVGDVAPVRTPTSGGPGWTCTTAGSFGAVIATTATTTSGSPVITFSGLTCVVPDDYLTIAGVTGNLHVLSINVGANTATVDQNASASVSGAAITRTAPVFSNTIPVAQGGTALASGTSGGVLGFTASGTLASSVALTNHALVVGGGAGATPTPLASLGTATTVLHGAAAGNPTFGAVDLNADVSGLLPVANAGLGVGTLTAHGVLVGAGTSPVAVTAVGTSGQVLTSNGPGVDPTFQTPAAGGVSSVNTRTGAVTLAGTDIPTFVASGASHAAGAVPDPGVGAGTTKFLREDATFAVPAGVGGSVFADNVFAVQSSADATKQLLTDLSASTASTNLTLRTAQTTTQILNIPNIKATDTVATLGVANLFVAPAQTAVAPPASWSFTGGAHTALSTGSVGVPEFNVDLSQTKQWTGTTTVTNYIAAQIKAPVLSATAATTFAGPTTFEITGPPTGGANATISGAFAFLVNSGNAQFNGTLVCKVAPQQLSMTQGNSSSGNPQQITITGATSNTSITAGANNICALFNYGQTQQHATGTVALNQTILMTGPTLSAVAASTFTVADTLAISAPVAGTNATLTAANALHVTSGQTQLDGNLSLAVAGGKVLIKEGSNASMGVATLVLGTVTVSNTLITANTRIMLTVQSLGTVSLPTVVAVTARSAGTSFTITSASATDTSVIAWLLIEPAP